MRSAVIRPTGPRGHLLSGHLPYFRRDSLSFLARCGREYGDAVRLRFGSKPVFLLNHPDLIEEVLVHQNRRFIKTADDYPRLLYAEQLIQEALRLYPPVWILGRQPLEDVEVGGLRIPRGSIVMISPWVVHRDPRYFADPDRFDPDRWAGGLAKRLPRFAYFPFGGGPRLCIGQQFALMEAVLTLGTIAQAFRLELVPGQPVELESLATLRPRSGMMMRLTARG